MVGPEPADNTYRTPCVTHGALNAATDKAHP